MEKLPFFKYEQIFTSPFRTLVKEAHAIFTTIPRKNTSEMTRSNVVTISRRYRSIVRECVNNLMMDPRADKTRQIKTFRELEIIWNLCEILLLDVNQTGTLIIQLRSWIKMHFDDTSSEAKLILKELEDGAYKFTENDEQYTYWNLLIKLVLRGEVRRAIQLLKCHYKYGENNQMQLVASMLTDMPVSTQYIVHEFCGRWSAWSDWCKRELETHQFDNNEALLKIVRILSNDTKVYEELAPECDTWYQLMVSYLLYTDPCIKDTDMSELSKRIIAIFKKHHPKHANSPPAPDSFDEIIISAFEYDLIQVISRCCSHLDDNWWFVTHFIDLLHRFDQLRIHEIIESEKMRESFIRDYASTLFDDEQLWPIAITYLDQCQDTGKCFLESLLSRVRLDINDNFTANKIIAIAKKRGLVSLSKSVCKIMAQMWLQASPFTFGYEFTSHNQRTKHSHAISPVINLSNALYWVVRSGDGPLTTFISDQCLSYYCQYHEFPEILESLRTHPLENERLAFLVKYYELRQIIDGHEGCLGDAGNLATSLVVSRVYPKFFCRELATDMKSLLKSGLLFSTDETLDLMKSFEENDEDPSLENDLELHRGLVCNMAKALMNR